MRKADVTPLFYLFLIERATVLLRPTFSSPFCNVQQTRDNCCPLLAEKIVNNCCCFVVPKLQKIKMLGFGDDGIILILDRNLTPQIDIFDGFSKFDDRKMRRRRCCL